MILAGNQTVAQLRQLILNGTLAPGETLRQEELARRLQVSRTPLREALATLAAEGLVQVNPRRSMTVFKPSMEDLKELFSLRVILESAAIERAAPSFPRQELSRLESLIDQMESAPTSASFNRLNQQFHDICYLPSGLPPLLALIGQVRGQATPYSQMMLATQDHRRGAQAQHLELVIALRERDAQRAAQVTREHLQSTIDTVVAELSERNRSADGDQGTETQKLAELII